MELGCCSEMRPWRHNPTSVTRLYCHSKGSRSISVSRQPLLENHHMKYDKLTYQSPLQWCPGGTLVTSCHIFLEPCNLLLFLWNDSIGGTWWQCTLSSYPPPRVVLPPPHPPPGPTALSSELPGKASLHGWGAASFSMWFPTTFTLTMMNR